MKKGQAAIEFLLIFAAVLVLIFIATSVNLQQISTINTQKVTAQSQGVVEEVAAAAQQVYAQGEGAKKRIFVTVPQGYEPNQSSISNRTIVLHVSQTDYSYSTDFDIYGSLPRYSGGQWLWIVSEGNRVRVGDAMITLDKSAIYMLMNSNSSGTDSFSVTSIWDSNITVLFSKSWTPAEVTLSYGPGNSSLSTGEKQTVSLDFGTSNDAIGYYSGEVSIQATDGEQNETINLPITVEVVKGSGEDTSGPVVSNVTHAPSNATSQDEITIRAIGDDSATGGSVITGCELEVDLSESWNNISASDGAFDEVTEETEYALAPLTSGQHTVRVRCSDDSGNTGQPASYTFLVDAGTGTGQEDGSGPIVIGISHTQYPTTFTNITLNGTATDIYTGNSTLVGCNVSIDSQNWIPLSASDGSWDNVSEPFSYNLGPVAVGEHTVEYQCIDEWGNAGSIQEDSFLVVNVDIMIILDKSGSMADTINQVNNSAVVSTSHNYWTAVKNLSVSENTSGTSTLAVSLKTSVSSCRVYYEARVGAAVIASGNRTSTSYATFTTTVNLSGYAAPYNVELWLKSQGACTASNQEYSLAMPPTKMQSAQSASKSFVDLTASSTYVGLVLFSTSATTDKVLAQMTPANKQALKNAIDAATPLGSTCIECGLDNAVNELISARANPDATKVAILLTDGISTAGDSIAGAVYARENNVTVYTIGFGSDVDSTELTNVALLANGEYYFAPDEETLIEVFNSLGRQFKGIND